MKMRSKVNITFIFLVFLAATVGAMTLSSCGSETPEEPPYATYEVPGDDYNHYNEEQGAYEESVSAPAAHVNLQIADAINAPNFGTYYSLNFREAHIGYWGGDLDWLNINQPMAIWADVPLTDFQVIGIYLSHRDDGAIYATKTHAYYTIGLLDTPLVMEWFFTAGLFPNNGISFVDTDGNRRFYAIQAAYGHDESIHSLLEFEDGGLLFPPWD